MQIPECGTVTECPKCQALEPLIITVFHDQPQQVQKLDPDPCTKLVLLTPSEELEEFDEHLCRQCRRCGFGWVEQVARKGSVYERAEEEPGEYQHCGCDFHGDHAGCDDSCELRGCAR